MGPNRLPAPEIDELNPAGKPGKIFQPRRETVGLGLLASGSQIFPSKTHP